MKQDDVMELDLSIARFASRASFPPTVDILGCQISSLTILEALATIETWITRAPGRCRFVVATGFHGIWEAQKAPEFKSVLNSSDLFCPDGIAPVWLSRVMGEPLIGRVPGPDLLTSFISIANIKGYSSFFLGDTPETLELLKSKVQQKYPGHRFAGALSPPFRALTADEDSAIVDMIHKAKPDVLWVALGLPKQEWWIYRHLDQLEVPVAVAVGAAFGFLSGTVKRAPAWMGYIGFEWLWRLAMEPKKLWRRDLIDGPLFLAHAVRECARLREQSRHRPDRD
jgi:N-acetylglucosaminyldiphosphoundecaprenol N-acetyl-beta-D-mannosaminyltransferase